MAYERIDESWYRRPPGVPSSVSAGGVIVRWAGDQLLVALVRESGQPDFILPKGATEPGEDLEGTARREIEEEAGLTHLIFLTELGVRERLNYRKRSWKIIHYYLFYTRQSEASPTDIEHDYRCEWFPIDRLPSMFWPEQEELIRSSRPQILRLALPFRGD